MNRGFTLVELLVTVAVLGLLAGTAVAGSGRDQAHLELEVALRRLRIGLDRGRLAAERQQQPCGLHLTARGWHAPVDETRFRPVEQPPLLLRPGSPPSA